MTVGSAYPLDRPLPPGVAPGGGSIGAFYKRFPVFSWPWIWRRFILLSPLAIIPALIVGLSYGAVASDFEGAIVVALGLVAVNLLALVAGPLLGMVLRQLPIKDSLLEPSVTFAILMGAVAVAVLGDFIDRFEAARTSTLSLFGIPGLIAPFGHRHDFLAFLTQALPTVYYFVLGGVFSMRLFRTENDRWLQFQRKAELEAARRQRDESDARLAVLQAQVEPHFLFNTLASLRPLVSSDPKRAVETIDALAEHLRATLPRLRAQSGVLQPSTLGEQFAICASFLKVMHVRMGERLRTSVDLPPHLAEVPFPPLMLISLVENAIKHGVEPQAGPVEVKLEASVQVEQGERILEVRVCDDGVGLSLGMGEGTGLANIRAQLGHRFGGSASLTLDSREPAGVVARIRIPIALLAA